MLAPFSRSFLHPPLPVPAGPRLPSTPTAFAAPYPELLSCWFCPASSQPALILSVETSPSEGFLKQTGCLLSLAKLLWFLS